MNMRGALELVPSLPNILLGLSSLHHVTGAYHGQAAPLSVSALPGPSELVLVPGHNVSAEAVQALMAQSGQQIHQVRGMGTCGGRIAMAARWLPWLKEVCWQPVSR